MGLVLFPAWYGFLFGVSGAVLAATCSASIRSGLWLTAGLFLLAGPWYPAWHVMGGGGESVVAMAMFMGAFGAVPLLVGYLPTVWAAKWFVSQLRGP